MVATAAGCHTGFQATAPADGQHLSDSLLAGSTWNRMVHLRPPVYPVFRTSEPPQIDGHLDDAVWHQAPLSASFRDIEGNPERQPTQDTRFMATWDQEYIYVGIRLEEADLWGTLIEKNSVLYWENDIELFLDPDGDFHNYHEAEWNVLGTIWELSLDKPYRDGGPIRNPNNMDGLIHAVSVDGSINDPSDVDQGWQVELAIPWSEIEAFDADPLPPEHGTTWRVNLSRVQWPLETDSTGGYRKIPGLREHNQVWSPTGLVDMHRPERWGWWVFLETEDSWSGLESEVQNTIREQQILQDRLMAIYYHAADYRSRTGSWPAAPLLPNWLTGPARCASYSPSAEGYDAVAWSCSDGIVPLEASDAAYSIDHRGHMERLH